MPMQIEDNTFIKAYFDVDINAAKLNHVTME